MNRCRTWTAGLLAAVGVFSARADVTVRCTANGPNQTVCRIDEPVVNQRLTQYPQIVFQPGETVTVNAGGCVQTGGTGATWKRYVNPSGPNSNRLYWGTISIPGATEGVMRVSDVIGQTLTVSSGIRQPLVLELGYVDDDYSDNSYDNHDDGTENQCRNQPNAFVILTIQHAGATPCAGNSGSSPLDLVWTKCDLNGFPFNPTWQFQVTNAGQVPPYPLTLCPAAAPRYDGRGRQIAPLRFPASCISWPVTYDYGYFCGPHVNYFAVTYQGPVNWDSVSGWGTDSDWNFFMFPQNNFGMLGAPNPGGIEIEFDSQETVNHFSSTLWTNFHQLADTNKSAAQAFIHQQTAVVTSLFGLDCGHPSCASEEHPAYVMAVDMDDSNLNDDQWGVFARNWGNEGFCSDQEHTLLGNDLKVVIPWLPGATAVAVLPDTQLNPFGNSGSNAAVSYQITVANGQGILIDFTLPDPSQQMGIEGEVHLQWTLPPAIRSELAARRAARRAASAISRSENEEDKPESRISELLTRLPAQQQAAIRTRLATGFPVQPAVARPRLPMRPVLTVAQLPAPPRLGRPVVPQAVNDPRHTQRSEALRQALCEAYKNNVPGYPSACVPPERRVR